MVATGPPPSSPSGPLGPFGPYCRSRSTTSSAALLAEGKKVTVVDGWRYPAHGASGEEVALVVCHLPLPICTGERSQAWGAVSPAAQRQPRYTGQGVFMHGCEAFPAHSMHLNIYSNIITSIAQVGLLKNSQQYVELKKQSLLTSKCCIHYI